MTRQSERRFGRSNKPSPAPVQPDRELAADIAAMLSSLPDAFPETAQKDADKPGRRDARQPRPFADPFEQLIEEEFAQPSSAPPADDAQSLSRRIIERLEEFNLSSVSRLRIEVHAGVVVVAGEVPSAYERQLIGHFCRQVPGVVKFVDGMVVRQTQPEPARPRRSAPRRPFSPSVEWRLPVRTLHAGAALGLVVLIWVAISLGRTGRPERLPVHPVYGTLEFEGRPAAGAAIVLYPEDPSLGVRPRATVNEDGTFELTSYEPGDGAPAGDYKATLEWRRPMPGQAAGDEAPPPPNVLPAAYARPHSSPVRITVDEGQNEFPTITFPN